jgi:hypothetical protein
LGGLDGLALDAPGRTHEVVQIGAVRLDAETLREVDCFEMLVRPRVNPVLSDYLTALTNISNDDLAYRGVDFVVAYRAFLDFAGEAESFAHGRDDLILLGNLKLMGGTRHCPCCATPMPCIGLPNRGSTSKASAPAMSRKQRARFRRPQARCLADARGVAAGFRVLIEKGAPNPF